MDELNRRTLALILTAVLVGCDNEHKRLAEQAAHNTEIQAQQNQEMARVHREVAQGTNRLVGADAEARQAMFVLQQHLQDERSQIGAQRESLEAERRKIATERQRDPIVAAAIANFGILLGCLLPLGLCGYLLHSLYGGSSEETIGEVLLMDLVSETPLLLPESRIQDPPRLPASFPDHPLDDERPPF